MARSPPALGCMFVVVTAVIVSVDNDDCPSGQVCRGIDPDIGADER